MCKHKNGLFLFYANSLPGRRFVMSGSVSPLPWTGNKGCIYTTIDAFMPPHRTYVEACMGSAEVFLRKKPVEKEIINDYNGDLVRFFRVLQRNENLERLIGRLFLSFNSEQIFRANKVLLAEVPNILDDLTETSVIIENTQWNDFDLAVAFYENQVFSFSSTGKNFAITKKDMTKRFGRLIAACARLRNATRPCTIYTKDVLGVLQNDPHYQFDGGYDLQLAGIPQQALIYNYLTASATVDGNAVDMREDNGSANAAALLKVVNNPGFDLPDTGDNGTMLLSIIGIVTMAGAAVVIFLATRKKSNPDRK